MLREQIIEKMTELKMAGMLAAYDELSATAQKTRMTGEKLVLSLLEAEYAEREARSIRYRLGKARFPVLKELAQFDFQEKHQQEEKLYTLATGDFLKRHENIIFVGGSGTGKTHLATAIGIEACGRGLSVGVHRTASLVNRLSEAKKTGQIGKLFASLRKLDLLICDEWGYVPLDREAAQLLFQVISDSYERRSVIITTNLEFSRWVGIFYDEQMTAAIIDRLIHHSYLVLFDGPSNRVRDSLMRVNA